MKHFETSAMLKFDEAFDLVMGSARQLGTERVDLGCALNRVLAEDVASDMDMPPFNKSAMDGFACRRADLANELAVIETIPAGTQPTKTIGPNQCAKIMTGAVVPEGADCVIMVEYTQGVGDDRIRFVGKDTDDHICPKGEDVKRGEVVLRAGELIKAAHIAVLASLGCVSPLVWRRPKVGITATGDELVEPGQKPAPHQIRNSNSFQLAAQVESASAIPTNYGIAVDTRENIDGVLKRAMAENDVVLISGGVSVGDYDLVKDILKANGVRLLFERVAVKPGRPTVFGLYSLGVSSTALGASVREASRYEKAEHDKRNTNFVFGLPGNPVSTFVIFELLVKPFLYKLMGHEFEPVLCRGRLKETITREKTERDSWLPVSWSENGKVIVIEFHGSGHIDALCKADGLICVPAGVAQIKEGTTVVVRQI